MKEGSERRMYVVRERVRRVERRRRKRALISSETRCVRFRVLTLRVARDFAAFYVGCWLGWGLRGCEDVPEPLHAEPTLEAITVLL
jgi:hypothetical protein